MRTTTALITNQVANEKIKEKVVMPHVRQAIALPVSCQNCGFSGSHLGSLAMPITPLT
jgi:predicted glutamine amidotransferase